MIFDSCILIDALKNHVEARRLIVMNRERAISVVTRSEVLAGADTEAAQRTARALLGRFVNIEVDAALADLAGHGRREHRLKLPDALVLASAQSRGVGVVTRDRALARAAGTVPAYIVD